MTMQFTTFRNRLLSD